MARVQINQRKLSSYVRGQATVRAQTALGLYRAYERQHQKANNPFAEGPGPRRSGIEALPNGIRIFVESPGAEFFEFGNDDAGEFIEAKPGSRLWLQLKQQAVQRMIEKGARVQYGRDGRPYLVLKRVRTYEGRNALQKSVRVAFGLGPM